jgi:hypothetical protein
MMKKVLLLIFSLLFFSCSKEEFRHKSRGYFINGAGYRELDKVRLYKDTSHNNLPYKHYHLNGRYWYYESQAGDWYEYQDKVRDKLLQRAKELGKNPIQYLNKYWDESEDNSHS